VTYATDLKPSISADSILLLMFPIAVTNIQSFIKRRILFEDFVSCTNSILNVAKNTMN
jgi:hypothetical protein